MYYFSSFLNDLSIVVFLKFFVFFQFVIKINFTNELAITYKNNL